MSEDAVVTLKASRGQKYDETGQCIATYNRSIVFMPRSVQPDEVVRVRLISVGKPDRNGQTMYRAEFAPINLVPEETGAIANEAQELRRGLALAKAESEALLRASGITRDVGFAWCYFCGSGIYGSSYSPAALTALCAAPSADDKGLIELLLWILRPEYFVRTQERRQSIDQPELPEDSLNALRGKIARGERVLSSAL